MQLTRAFSKVIHNKCNIYLFGYEGDEYVTKVQRFNNYFYYPIKDVQQLLPFGQFISIQQDKQYKSMYGTKMVKVIYFNDIVNRQITKNQYMFNKAFSLDIKPEIKYILDNKLEWSMKRNTMFFDIQTWVNPNFARSNFPQYADMPITSIQTWNNVDEEYYIVYWHKSLKQKIKDKIGINIIKQNGVNYIQCINQQTMINTFFALLKDKQIDCISGWYSSQYDLPYIINRCKKIGINPDAMTPGGSVRLNPPRQGQTKWTTYITGLDHIDMMDACDDLNIKRSDNKLDTVAKQYLSQDLMKVKSSSWKDWQNNLQGFLKYGIRDVQILKQLNEKLHIVPTYCSFQIVSNIHSLSKIFSKTAVAQGVVLKMFWDEYIFPNIIKRQKQKYTGAKVFQPKPGLHKNVALLDFKSLYPTTISTFNLSPETYVISHTQAQEKGIDIDNDVIKKLKQKGIKYIDTGYHEDLFGKRYIFLSQKSKVGLFAKVQKGLLQMRMRVRKQIKNHKKGTTQYIALDKKQHAIKIVMNGAYGAFANAYYRFFKPQIADSITFFARTAINTVFQYFEDKYSIYAIYGDTDSVGQNSFVTLEDGQNINIQQLFENGHQYLRFQDKQYRTSHQCILYYDEQLNKVLSGKINYIYRHKVEKPLYRIILQNGKFVDVTGNHSLMVMQNNRIVQKKAQHIYPGDEMITID